MSWDDVQSKELAILARAGLSASSIALVLNEKFGTSYSRNAIIGRMSRSNLALKGKPVVRAAPSILPSVPQPIGNERRCTVLELTSKNCHWPFGEPQSPDFFFCGGDAVDGKPYCAGHCQVAYRGHWN